MVCCGAGVVGRSVPESPGSLFSPSPPLLLTTVLVSCPTKLPLPLSKSLHSCSLGRCLCLVTLHSSLLKHCGEIRLWVDTLGTQTVMKYVMGKKGGYITTTRLGNVGAATAKEIDI